MGYMQRMELRLTDILKQHLGSNEEEFAGLKQEIMDLLCELYRRTDDIAIDGDE